MARYRVVKTGVGDAPPDVDQERERLGRLGAEVVAAVVKGADDLVEALRGADACINYGGRFTAEVFERLDRSLWLIVHAGTGYDPIDVEAATEHGVMVANLPFQCLHEVANSAIAYVLTLNRKLVEADRHVRAGKWNRFSLQPIGTIYGQTLGLLGFGNIARATAKKALALDMAVVAYDPYVDPALATELGVELLPLEEVLRRADYVSSHLPHNPQTHHLLSEAQFRLMKPTAYFVNTARGKVVDEAALVRALREGRIAGAGLDVFEVEPLPLDSPLRTMENVLLAPHLAGTSVASAVNNRRHAIEQVEEALRDGKPSALVNRSVQPRRLART
ncbi:MAG TPA: C-terminal binding protein [Chloroflexota bacterium]|jgi:D-3-phosphoglycerate dehydrogenase|nr:C-terminal binding protein [Chloroflexota bacterium]